jgi:hypothetical protein
MNESTADSMSPSASLTEASSGTFCTLDSNVFHAYSSWLSAALATSAAVCLQTDLQTNGLA